MKTWGLGVGADQGIDQPVGIRIDAVGLHMLLRPGEMGRFGFDHDETAGQGIVTLQGGVGINGSGRETATQFDHDKLRRRRHDRIVNGGLLKEDFAIVEGRSGRKVSLAVDRQQAIRRRVIGDEGALRHHAQKIWKATFGRLALPWFGRGKSAHRGFELIHDIFVLGWPT